MIRLFFRRLWRRVRVGRLTAAQRMADRWMIDSGRMAKRLASQHEALLEYKRSLDERADSLSADLDMARKLQAQHETTLESLRGENTVMGVEIAALTAANQLALERYRAETSIQTMRQAAAGTREER